MRYWGEHMRDVHPAQLWYPEPAPVPASQAQQSELMLTQETLIFNPSPRTSTPVKIKLIPAEEEPDMTAATMDKEPEKITPEEEEEADVVHPPQSAKHHRIASDEEEPEPDSTPMKCFSFEGPKDGDCTSKTEAESTVTMVIKAEVHSTTPDTDLEAKKSMDVIVIEDDTE